MSLPFELSPITLIIPTKRTIFKLQLYPCHCPLIVLSHSLYNEDTSGLYYKHILTIVSDDRKWCQYYKCTINVIDDASLALASVVNYDRKWGSKL